VARYRICVVTGRNGVVGDFELNCQTDREACVVAESMLQPGLKAEIWADGERIQKVCAPAIQPSQLRSVWTMTSRLTPAKTGRGKDH